MIELISSLRPFNLHLAEESMYIIIPICSERLNPKPYRQIDSQINSQLD